MSSALPRLFGENARQPVCHELTGVTESGPSKSAFS